MGWLAFAALIVSWLFYIRQIPDNWYGGGGTVGNRYFLNLLPLFVLMLPARREAYVVAGAALSAIFLGQVWLHPLRHSMRPGDHAMSAAFRALPPELTMLNDLSIFTDAWRKKVPYGDTEGNPHLHWPADPKAYYLYFTDDGTYGKDLRVGAEGFWLRGAAPAEVVLRALEPVRRMRVRVTGGPIGDRVTVRVCGCGADGGRRAGRDEGAGVRARCRLSVLRHLPHDRALPIGSRPVAARGPAAARGLRVDHARGGPASAAVTMDYRILPAATFHFLTPLYDLGSTLFGFGRGFKEDVVARAGLGDGMRVLDVGCGTGLLADAIKRAYPDTTVVGVDADSRILEIARRRIAGAGHSGVEFVNVRAERTGLESGTFDAALSTLVFHHLPVEAKEGAVREVLRLLRPGGRFLVVDLRPLMAADRPVTPEGRRSMRLALRANTLETVAGILTEAGLRVESVPPPKSWVPLLRTFALSATKPA